MSSSLDTTWGVKNRKSSLATVLFCWLPKIHPISGRRDKYGSPDVEFDVVLSASPPMTVVWPSRRNTCVVASRVLMTGAENWISFVAALSVCLTARLTYPSGLIVGVIVSVVPTLMY